MELMDEMGGEIIGNAEEDSNTKKSAGFCLFGWGCALCNGSDDRNGEESINQYE